MNGMADDEPIKPISWYFINGFGERDKANVTEQDVLTSIAFDKSGNYLTVGDKGGRVIVFNRAPGAKKGTYDYMYFTEFQSHESEFDYLKSIEIEEKINSIEWINRFSSSNLGLLSTNDKTIKLWKIYNKDETQISDLNSDYMGAGKGKGPTQLRIPKRKKVDSAVTAKLRKVFPNGHTYHINSLSQSADGENFISADDLRVNLWNLETTKEVFSAVDIKPANIEDLNEVITNAQYHPLHSDMFLFSSSKGAVKVCDLRINSQYEKNSLSFEVAEDPSKKNFFSEIINSISNAKFSANGRYIYSRDYLTVKVWDIRKNDKPANIIQVCDYLERKLCDLYESENIFDKFELATSPCSNLIMTGSYNGNVHIIDRKGNVNVSLEATFDQKKNVPVGASKPYTNKKLPTTSGSVNFDKKILQTTWHPHDYCVAIANYNCIFLFNGETKK